MPDLKDYTGLKLDQGKKLAPKQQMFVREYLIDLNATQAAIRAGYSKRTARSQGQRLLTNVDVSTAIAEVSRQRTNSLDITAERVLREVSHAAFLDPVDMFDNNNGTLLRLSEMPEAARRAIAGFEVAELYSGGSDDRKLIGYIKKIKLVSKEGTLNLAGRHLKLFTDKVEVSGNNGGAIRFENMSKTEISARILHLLMNAKRRKEET